MAVAVIINPISGGGRAGPPEPRARLAAAIIEQHGDVPEIVVTERAGHARQLAKSALQRGARLVLAWGGDGTINEVASALAFDESTAFGIIPAGSGNGLATELGISRDPAAALAQALKAAPRRIDAGELGGHLFFNVAGIGIDASIAARFNDPANVTRGLLGYARLTGQALFAYVPGSYRITADPGGSRVAMRAVLVSFANGAQYGNNARVAPRARVDDGVLDMVIVEERSRIRTLMSVPKLFTGGAERVPGCTIAQIRHATIECDTPMTYHVDGETVQGGTSLTARVHPGALWIAA
jgi:YegS/Rv2252/BmrU family lipid kinase